MDNTNDKTAASAVQFPTVESAYYFSDHTEVVLATDAKAYGDARAEEARREAEAGLAETRAAYVAQLQRLSAQRTAGGEVVGYHVCYDNGTSADYRKTESEAKRLARELVENGWLDVNVRTLTYRHPAQPGAEAAAQAITGNSSMADLDAYAKAARDQRAALAAAPTAQPTLSPTVTYGPTFTVTNPPRDEEGRPILPMMPAQPTLPDDERASPTFMDERQAQDWAWKAVRKDCDDGTWTTGEAGNYFGFFLHGWRYREQYEKQRRAALRQPGALPDEAEDAARLDESDITAAVENANTVYEESCNHTREAIHYVATVLRCALAAKQAGKEAS